MSKITRQKRNDNFTVVNNKVLQNKEMSWAAKGMLVYLLHLPDGWQINVADLWSRSKNGRDSTAAIMKELIDTGYVTRSKSKGERNLFKGYDYTVSDEPTVNGFPVDGKPVFGDSVFWKPETSKDYSNQELFEQRTINNKQLVETSLSTVVHDQVDDVIEDNAALLPQLDVDEEKKNGSAAKRKGSAAAKNPDSTPINAMWDILLEQSAKIGNDEPQFMSRYGRDFKLLYAILKQRAEKRQEPITDQVEPFRRYVTKIVDYIIKGRKVPQHQFTANNLARNFNPGYLHTSFNQICATIQAGVTVPNQPNKPTAYNESEVYRNFDSSQAAF
jgi:hypothetical protein